MNPFFRAAIQQARKIITNPKKTRATLDKAIKKSGHIKTGDKGSMVSVLKENLTLFFMMLGDFVRGRYKNLPISTAVKMLAAVIYFLFLIDLIPDFLAVIGLTDDAAVLAWVIKSISDDIEKYKIWRLENIEDEVIEEVDVIELPKA